MITIITAKPIQLINIYAASLDAYAPLSGLIP